MSLARCPSFYEWQFFAPAPFTRSYCFSHALSTTSSATRATNFPGEALSYGIEEEKLEGITVRVFGSAKTVADCFKYRNKIGLEALRDCYRQRKATMDELFMAAKVCRVARVMQRYLESLA